MTKKLNNIARRRTTQRSTQTTKKLDQFKKSLILKNKEKRK